MENNYQIDSQPKKLYYVDPDTTKETLFIPIYSEKDKHEFTCETKISYEHLKETIYGKILIGAVGYNPSEWWKYISVKKKEIKYY